MSCIYFVRNNRYAKDLIRVLLDHLGLRLPVRHTQQAVNICDAKLGRYPKAGVSECGCAVVVADTDGRDPHQVIDVVAEHLRKVGLQPQLSFDKYRLVGLISLESGGGIAVVLAHPCQEAWLDELPGITSSACSDLINADKQKRGEYEKSHLPSLVKAELRNKADLPKFVENFRYAVTCCGGGRATA
ncbi:MAG: hypothetical protein ACO2PM_05445 [Pyrobaculum sp.]|jgi:hypothetical protein